MGFRLVEFAKNNDVKIEHEFQVDEQQKSRNSRYDMIIGSDLMWNMGVNILYSDETIRWLDDLIPLKPRNSLTQVLYAIHTDSPLIKDMEERQNRVLDADYSAVDILAMVNELNISSDSKIKLRRTLEKFPELFGGGLGRLKGVEPAKIVLKKNVTPFKGAYYNFPKAYQEPAKVGIRPSS